MTSFPAYSSDMIVNDLARRFWLDVKQGADDECWPWRKSTGSHGYGQTYDGVTVRLAHRVAFVLAVGPIPGQLTVDHICHNKVCCNPSHLRLLTNVDNATDNLQDRKTHCPRGHTYNEENTYMDPKGHRRCRPCARQTKREWYAKWKAAE